MSQVQVQVTREKEGRVCRVELNLPAKKNTLTMEIILELTKVFKQLSDDSKLHMIILSGKGSHFCAGGDLRWMFWNPETSDDTQNIQEVSNLFNMLESIKFCSVPIVAEVYGSVFGGGLGLVAACDIAIAQNNTKFCFSELKLHLIPAVISPFILNKISPSFIKEWVLSARIFSAEEAQQKGLVHFVGTEEESRYHLNNLKDHFLSCDPIALRQSKKLLANIPTLPFQEAKEYCIQALAERRKNPKVIEKISQFLNRKNKKSD